MKDLKLSTDFMLIQELNYNKKYKNNYSKQ